MCTVVLHFEESPVSEQTFSKTPLPKNVWEKHSFGLVLSSEDLWRLFMQLYKQKEWTGFREPLESWEKQSRASKGLTGRRMVVWPSYSFDAEQFLKLFWFSRIITTTLTRWKKVHQRSASHKCSASSQCSRELWIAWKVLRLSFFWGKSATKHGLFARFFVSSSLNVQLAP